MNITCKKVKQKKKLEIILKVWKKRKKVRTLYIQEKIAKASDGMKKKGKNLDF